MSSPAVAPDAEPESPLEVIRLDRSELDLRPPPQIAAAAAVAARAGWPGSSPAGEPELRHRLARRLRLRTDGSWTPDQVLVTAGATQALSLVLSAVLRAGDEVLLPDPGWPRYPALVRRRGAVPVGYEVSPRRGLLPSVDEISRLLTPRTKALVINSPGNPTGAVFPPELVQEIVALTERRGIFLISDEVYDEVVYDGSCVTASQFGGARTVSVHSFSKTYAMSDWRVGYLVGETRLVRSLAVAQETELARVSPIAQAAAIAALSGPQRYPEQLRSTLRRRRDNAVEALQEAGLDVQHPAAGFFLLVPLAPGADARLAARELLRCGVAVVPGTVFGVRLPHHVRLSLTVPDTDLACGVHRLGRWAQRTRAGAQPLTVAPSVVAPRAVAQSAAAGPPAAARDAS